MADLASRLAPIADRSAETFGAGERCPERLEAFPIVLATRHRPVRGARGFYRANLRHGVSRVETGRRFTLGVIFHDAA